ncbi:MAG: hypothetical protein HYY96_11665 [Candidatus Tectomicrobia bacterium]|nr:hypothetical protein [Candidatus Tectomicrobia bacterium]
MPTQANWLNQIECWFNILTRRAPRGAGFTSAAERRAVIETFLAVSSPEAAPYEWRNAVVRHVSVTKRR